jgi:hypothetical protein
MHVWKHLQDVFCDRVISSDLWPRSRNLIGTGFYLWGSLHDKVYKKSHTLEELRNSFRCEIKGICGEELQRANTNVFGRYTRLFWQQGNIQSQLHTLSLITLCKGYSHCDNLRRDLRYLSLPSPTASRVHPRRVSAALPACPAAVCRTSNKWWPCIIHITNIKFVDNNFNVVF